MKVLAVTIVCLVAITTTHGFGIGLPPFGMHPLGLGIPPFRHGIPPFSLGIHPLGLGLPHLGLGVSPLVVGSTGAVKAVSSHGNGHDNDKYDAYAAAASYGGAAPTTIAASNVVPAGHAAYEPVYVAV